MPSPQLLEEMNKFNQDLIAAGVMLDGGGLQPSSELVSGYWLWDVKSLEEAISWVKRCPNPMLEISDIEIRPLYGMDDFATTK
jgi:hypothetical protein